MSAISSGHAPPTATIATPPSASCFTRCSRPSGAAHSHASARPGTTISAAAIFVSKPRPIITPHHTSHLVRPSASPRTRNHSAAVAHSTSRASGLLWREIATVIGVSASARPPAKPAARPNGRRTRSYTSATAPMPISACGTSIASEWKPNTRTDSACTHRASGGLSTVCTPLTSNEP